MTNKDGPDSQAISKAIDFLETNNALDLETVPWGTYSDNDAVWQVDYDALGGGAEPSEGANWSAPPEDFLRDLEDALSSEPEPLPGVDGHAKGAGRAVDIEWDTCAWYQPIHFFASDWGIYIHEKCLLRLAVKIARSTDSKRLVAEKVANVTKALSGGRTPAYWGRPQHEMFIRAAFILLYLHEHYHHRVECLGLRLHVVVRKGLYVPYFKTVYGPARGTDDLLEEALANASMYLRLSEKTYSQALPEAIKDAMRQFLRSTFPFDPPGYRQATNYLTVASFDSGENRLQACIRETTMTPIQPAFEWDLAPRMTQSFFNLRSNIYAIVPAGARCVIPATALPASCSTDAMITICRRAGYEVEASGGKGSHVKLKKPKSPTIILPRRKDLSVGVIKNTLGALGQYRVADLPSLMR